MKHPSYILIPGLIFVVIGVLVCVFVFPNMPSPHPPLWQIERITRVDFPEDVKIIGSNGSFLFGIKISANIEIEKRYMDSFIKSLNEDPIKDIQYALQIINATSSKKTEWWHPERIKNPIFFKFVRRTDKYSKALYYITIDNSNEDKANIYFMYMND